MILHEHTLIAEDILEEAFVCDLNHCKGACCIEGDVGAPLTEDEVKILEKEIEAIKPYMRPDLRDQIEAKGFYETDEDGDLVTKCNSGRECVFAIQEGGAWKCAIEKAHHAGATAFYKPISCHLYPIRLLEMDELTGLNYDRWHICKPACKLGKALQVPVYKFLEKPLVRRFGQDWYDGLEAIAKAYKAGKI